MKKKLTAKEQAFVDGFLGASAGNATDAAARAGYGKNRNSSRQLAHRLLTKVHIQRAIATRTDRVTKRSILTADERDELLSDIARGAKLESTKERIRAISELNKVTGRHSVKLLHEGKVTLEQVLAESRR